MIKIDPKKTETKIFQEYLLSSVGPRPIALASTIDNNNTPNLSPFSFFNVFSGNPPILIFSPARRIRNNTEKDTLKNLKEIKEVVINIVNEDIVENMVISSFDYPSDIDEFIESVSYPRRLIGCSKYGGVKSTEFIFENGDILLFGREDVGLPVHIRDSCDHIVSIPMVCSAGPDGKGGVRSLNLSVATSILSYVASSQLDIFEA